MNLFERNQISRRISRLFIVSDDHETTTRVVFNLLLLFFALHDLPYSSAQMEEPPPPPTDGMTFGPRFNPSMAIIMVVLVSVFFLLGFFSVYVRRCAESRFPHQNTDPSLIFGGSSRRARRAGLDASVINTFPTFLYSAVKGLKIGKGTLECAVCLNEFKDDETLRLIPKCSHVFHPYCIDAWLAAHDTCPVCRANLEPEPGESISSVNAQILNPERSPVRPEQRSDYNDEALLSPDDHRVDVGSPPGSSTNPNRAPKSRSPAWKFPSLFPRSHSTGHSPVQPGEDCERFTLRLPEEVRSQLMNSTLNRTKSCVVLRSPRKGFRSRSVGFFYERFGRPSRPGLWEFCMTPPPLFPKAGSVGSPKATASSGEATLRGTPTRNLFRSVKSPFDRLCVGQDCDGERSFDRLRPQSQV